MNSDFILGVHALVFLNHKAETLNSETLAQNICTNPVRVRRVMARLRKAGLVETRGWRENAGYFFPSRRTRSACGKSPTRWTPVLYPPVGAAALPT